MGVTVAAIMSTVLHLHVVMVGRASGLSMERRQMSIRMLQLHPPLRQALRLHSLPVSRIPLHWPPLNLPAKLLFWRLYLQLHNQQPGPPSTAKSDKDGNSAAIVGGALGGVIGLALILGACWFFLALKRRQTPHSPPMTDGRYSPELGNSPIDEAPT